MTFALFPDTAYDFTIKISFLVVLVHYLFVMAQRQV